MTITAYHFYSTAWIAAVQEELQKLVDSAGEQASELNFTIFELYRDAPEIHALRDGAAGLTMTIANRRATVSRGLAPAFDLGIEAYWTDAERAVRLTGPEYDKDRTERGANGRLKFSGDLTNIPPFLGLLHDAIVRRTA